MEIKTDKNLILKIARLSKINLKEIELKNYEKDFEEIIISFGVLNQIDVTSIKPSFRPFEEKNKIRLDVPTKCLSQEEALKFTKNKKDGFFIGPKTIE